MTGILIVSHGDTAPSLLALANMIVGEVPYAETVSFDPTEGMEDLEAHVDAALSKLQETDWVLALADIPGGSPANVLGKKVLQSGRIELLTGVNAPMLLEAVLSRAHCSREELLEKAFHAGREGIQDVRKLLEMDVD